MLIAERSREAARLEQVGGMEAIKRAAELSASVRLFQYEPDQSRSQNNARRIDLLSGLKHQVMSVLEKTGIVEELGRDHFFPNKEHALKDLLERYEDSAEPQSK